MNHDRYKYLLEIYVLACDSDNRCKKISFIIEFFKTAKSEFPIFIYFTGIFLEKRAFIYLLL